MGKGSLCLFELYILSVSEGSNQRAKELVGVKPKQGKPRERAEMMRPTLEKLQ